MATTVDPPSRLARRLGLGDAVVVGLGSMIGAGVFAAIGPAAEVAGSGLLFGLAVAACVAACNAASSATLAAMYPASGGAYVYGRRRLGPFWGYLAGWGFIVGKTASCAAMALTVDAYLAPAWQRPIAVAAVAILTAVNYRGIQKTVALTRIIVALVLAALLAVVIGTLFGGNTDPGHLTDGHGGPVGVVRSAGLLFFAFAGYARIATLGEEVRDPSRTIPRAIAIAFGVTITVYAVVATSAIAAVGPAALAASEAPLAGAVGAGDLGFLAPVVRAGGVIAALGVLLSLIAGVGRTAFAMASDGELPRALAVVHPVHRVPHRAELVIGALIMSLVAAVDVRNAVGFSSFCVLTYYAIANASAMTLHPRRAGRTRVVAALGLLGCATLALTLPLATVVAGVTVSAAGAVLWAVRHRAGS